MLFRVFHRCLKCNTGLWFSPLSICPECERQIAVLEARRELLREQAVARRERWNKVAPFVPRPHPPEPALNGNPFYVVGQTASSIDADNPLQERRAAAALLLSAYAGAGGDAVGGGAGGDFSAASCGPTAAPEERQATPPAADSCRAPESPPAPSAGGLE